MAGELAYELEIKLQKFEGMLKSTLDKFDNDAVNQGKKTGPQMGKAVVAGLTAALSAVSFDKILNVTKSTSKIAMSIEDQMADVRKTTGLAGEEMKNFKNQVFELGKVTRTPIADLLDIAKVGGQLGIAKEEIFGFTDSINKLNVALGDEFSGGAEQITTEVGTLANTFREFKGVKPEESLLKIGNALNELGASGAATAPVVTDFAGRINGLAGQLGAGNILGLSAALQEMGVTAERGGSAVGRLVQRMSNKPDDFAKAIGMSSKEFKNLVNNNPNKALLELSRRLSSGGLKATEFAAKLDELGLDGVGTSEVLQKIGGNIELVQKRQDLANKSLQGTNSILDEYNIKNNTTAAAQEKFNNQMTILQNNIGEALLPALNGLFASLNPIITGFSNFASQNPVVVMSILGIAAGIAALATGISTVTGLMAIMGVTTIGALAVPLGIVLGVIAAVTAAATLLYFAYQNNFGGLKDVVDSTVKFVVEEAWPKIENLFKKFQERVMPAFMASWNYLKPFIEGFFSFFVGLLSNAFNVVKDTFNAIVKVIDGVFDIIDGIFTNDGDKVRKGFLNIFNGLAEVVGAVFKGVLNGIIDVINLGIRQVNNLRDKVKDFDIPGVGKVGDKIPSFPELKKLAVGTDYFQGGAALVGEAGPEMVYLPRGSAVATASETRSIINNSTSTVGSNNTYSNYGMGYRFTSAQLSYQ